MNPTVTVSHRSPLRALLQPFLDATTWHTVSYSLCSMPIGIATFTAATIGLAVAAGLLVTLVFSLLVLAALVPLVFVVARYELLSPDGNVAILFILQRGIHRVAATDELVEAKSKYREVGVGVVNRIPG